VCHAGALDYALAMLSFVNGILRSRLPVAAKIALATAGTMAEVPRSPIPPGGSELWNRSPNQASIRLSVGAVNVRDRWRPSRIGQKGGLLMEWARILAYGFDI